VQRCQRRHLLHAESDVSLGAVPSEPQREPGLNRVSRPALTCRPAHTLELRIGPTPTRSPAAIPVATRPTPKPPRLTAARWSSMHNTAIESRALSELTCWVAT
jgi:hypothetical protein